jgi:hypothetical protein
LSLSPARGLTLTASLGLTYGKYLELPTDAQFQAAHPITTDSKFPHTPEIAFALGAQYTYTLTNGLTSAAGETLSPCDQHAYLTAFPPESIWWTPVAPRRDCPLCGQRGGARAA